MMTEELSAEFLTFSQMLDDEENLPPLGSEGTLLLDLRATLRGTPELNLPNDFARQTAARVEKRFQEQSVLAKILLKVEPVLAGRPLSAQALPWVSLVAVGSLGSGFISWLTLGMFGTALLLVAAGWAWLIRRTLADIPGASPLVRPALVSPPLARLFYALPVLATLTSGIVCGKMVSALGTVSLSFRGSGSSLQWLGTVAGAAVSVLLLSALAPTWKALKRKSSGRPGWLVTVQLVHALWLGLGLQLVAILEGQAGTLPLQLWGTGLLMAVGIALLLSCLAPEKTPPGLLRHGLGQSLRSLLFGGVPVLATLIAFYQLNLTREIKDPALYSKMVADTETWLAEQKAIPPAQNGWTELKSYFLRPENSSAEYLAVRERLKGGGKLNETYVLGKTPESSLAPVEKNFLAELPRIESALQKPHFSYFATQELRMQALVPDFLMCRGVSQGLAGLACKALQQHNRAESLHYNLLNLQWSSKVRQGPLINLMIGVAQMSIALEPIQRWLGEGQASPEQLRQLLAALQAAEVSHTEFVESMQRETYLCNTAIKELLSSPKMVLEMVGDGHWSALGWLVPRSYWESERMAYLNLQLSQLSGWRDLGRPSGLRVEEMLPMSFAARELIPNSQRAQAQFMVMLSRMAALKTMTALELCRGQRGAYPEHLSELVPDYLAQLPVDAIHPNLWSKKPTFEYHKTSRGYELISQSPLYEDVQFRRRQVYGLPGKYSLEKLR